MGSGGLVVKAIDCKFKSQQRHIVTVGFLSKALKLQIVSFLYCKLLLVKSTSQMSESQNVKFFEGKVDVQKCFSDVGGFEETLLVIELGFCIEVWLILYVDTNHRA